MLYFSSSLFAAIISLPEVFSCFISWNIQVSMMFLYIISMCSSTENFPCFELNCRITSRSLGEQEILREQEVVSDCFNNFPVFS